MDEFGLVWLSSVWFDGVDFLKCSRSASQSSFTNLFILDLLIIFSSEYYRWIFPLSCAGWKLEARVASFQEVTAESRVVTLW